jgi:hypothetical protein
MKDVSPRHGLIAHFLSTISHPLAEDMNPQGDSTLLVVRSLHLVAQNPTSTPKKIPIHYLYSRQPAQPKECIPFTTHSPSGCTIHLSWLPMHFVGHESHSRLLPRTLNYSRSAHNSLHKALDLFPQQEMHYRLTTHFYRHTSHISNINTA